MIVTQEIARIAQALLKDSATSLVEATRHSLTPLNLTPGQVVQGEVLASLPQSRYLVRVANELLKMELPLNLQPGQTVELTYVTDEPRVVFALSKSANSGVPVQISDTGRWLNTLAREGSTPSAAPLPRPSLILPAPPDDPATLAEGLRNALSRSGTFYESHLAGWMRGNLPLTELLKEPQGSLSPLATHLPQTAAPQPPASPPPGGVEPQTIPIIREQLAVLTTGVFSWLGQVWPGQDMEWKVQEREAEGGAGGRNWQTEVRIAFPRLGEVRATLTLAGEGVAVTLVATEEQTVTLLSGGAERLRENMEGAGITLSGLAVRHAGS
ncbi:flagellar hook-length control protein FliK [Geobacter sp.]|uniref:flagellar hook-length control protein FliK n=1 Tax=Geobacter sp. TaxID=46610 RepID=UPI00262DAC5D|nr:flagellar hook-length control protein FliK [Geobacter sp.]